MMNLLFEIAPGAAVAHWFKALFDLLPSPEKDLWKPFSDLQKIWLACKLGKC